MKRYLLFLFIISSVQFQLLSQEAKKVLTLETAVLQQYRSLRPKSLPLFMWIPNTSNYTFLNENYQTLMMASVKNKLGKPLVSIQEVNEACASELSWFSGLEWKTEVEFWVNDGANFYSYNTKTRKGTLIHQIGDGENAIMSPASEYLAYTKNNDVYLSKTDGKKSITGTPIKITNNEGTELVSGQAIARSEFGITGGLFWSPDGKKLAFYEKDESKVHDYPLLDITTTPGTLNSIKYPMAGQASERAAVGVYDAESGKTVKFFALHGEENYLTNLSWTPDNNYVFLAEVNRDQNHMWLHVFDVRNGKFVKTILEEGNERWMEPEHAAYFPHPTSNHFIWQSEKSGFNNLYYYDFNGTLIKQLTQHDFVVTDLVGFKNGMIYYMATGVNPTESHLFACDLNGNTRKITNEAGTHNVSFSTDGKYMHDQFSSITVPNKEMIASSNGKVKDVLIQSEDKLIDYVIGQMEIGTITAKDGSTLYTRMIKPSHFDPTKKYPVLIYVYGGPHAQMITNSWLGGASLWMHWMAEQGYLIYTVDNRGSANRGFAFESQIHRRLGTVELEDQLSGVAYLKSLPYVDADRLAVHGWSFGGFMTGTMMLKAADTFKVGVAGGPVTDWKYYEIMYGERYMDTPEQNPKGYEESSLLTHADKLKGKFLLIHGTADDVVVMQHNYALIKRFVELGKQVEFFPYPMHKHNVSGKDRVHLMEKVLQYVIQNNQ